MSLRKNKIYDEDSDDDQTMDTSEQTDPADALIPWVEKYRPKTISDVIFQDEVVSVAKKSLQGNDFPNLLLYGPPGTGKTSTAIAMARDLFGDIYRDRVLELNASDERGIQIIREKVKKFAQLTASNKRPDGQKCPPLKIIILDEADSMTGAAQSALRRTMEKQTKTTRFCLICNYVSRIIEPIASRCSKFRFKPLAHDVLIKKLREIAKLERVNLENNQVLDEIINIAEGDMRRAITLLHSLFKLKGRNTAVTVKDVHELSGTIPEKWITDIVAMCTKGSFDKLYSYFDDLIAEGYSGNQFLLQLHDHLLSDKIQLDDNQLAVVCRGIATADHRILDGADEFIQILNVGSILLNELNKK